MKSKNKIMDSFEEFVALPLSILAKRIIQITGFKSDFVSTKSIDVELSDNAIQINCVNSEGAYNLLSSVIYKRKMNKKKKLEQNALEQAEKELDKNIEKLELIES